MKYFFRCCFVGLIIVGLTSQAVLGQREEVGRDPKELLAERLASLDVSVDRANSFDVMAGLSPLCAEPVLAALLSVNGADDATLRSLLQPDRLVQYVYLGAVEEHMTKASMTARRAWATVRFVLGLRRDRPASRFTAVALPRTCPGLATIDWSTLSP